VGVIRGVKIFALGDAMDARKMCSPGDTSRKFMLDRWGGRKWLALGSHQDGR
jgi:hypothetical protein